MSENKYGGEVDLRGTPLEPPPGLDPDCLLFLGDPDNKTVSPFQRGWMPVSTSLFFLLGSLYTTRGVKMPLRAGFYKHVLYALFGFGLGEGAWRWGQMYGAEKDIQYYHYMITHPEDFKAPEKKKYSCVLQPWIPMR